MHISRARLLGEGRRTSHCWTSQQWHPRATHLPRFIAVSDRYRHRFATVFRPFKSVFTVFRGGQISHCWTSQQWHPRERYVSPAQPGLADTIAGHRKNRNEKSGVAIMSQWVFPKTPCFPGSSCKTQRHRSTHVLEKKCRMLDVRGWPGLRKHPLSHCCTPRVPGQQWHPWAMCNPFGLVRDC